MELFVLIIVNFVFALAMYFMFSIRFSIALEKARKRPVTGELKANIQAAIEFINTSVDLMDSKNKSFYQLLRRAEETAGRLESLLTESNAGRETVVVRETKPKEPVEKNGWASAKSEKEALSMHSLERVLAAVGEDRLELMDSPTLRHPKQGAEPVIHSNTGPKNDFFSAIAGTGRTLKKMLGISEGNEFSEVMEIAEVTETRIKTETQSEDMADGNDRVRTIRTLAAKGFQPAEISRTAGIGLPEVELVMALPELTRRPRKYKIKA